MAKQIIILERINAPSDLSFRVAFWAAVPAARQSFYANATAKSAFVNASAAELVAIQTGAILEDVQSLFYPAGTALATIQADLIARFADFQNALTNNNAYVRYGTSWDGATWTLVSVT